jgi:transcriptional regulator with XRE-family HTH domain
VRERRQDLGLTQEQLGERVGEGVRQSEISRLEKGTVSLPHPNRLVSLARALEVPLGDLLLHAGLIEAYQRAHFDTTDATVASGDPAVKTVVGGLAEVLTVLAEGRARLADGPANLAEADRLIEQAELMILSVLTRLEPRGYTDIRPPIGVVKHWETTGLCV